MTRFSTSFRMVGLALLVVLASFAVSSCLTPPNYSDTPSIDFKRITQQRYKDASGTFDSVKVTVSFKDGDGDLGLTNDDTNPPYQYDGGKNKYYNNYFLQPQIQQTDGTYKNLDVGYGYASRYPPLNSSGRSEPLKGDLTFNTMFYVGSSFPINSKVRFQVSIVDRALHESNTVVTDPIQF